MLPLAYTDSCSIVFYHQPDLDAMNSDDNLVSRYANDTKQFGGRPTEDPSTDDPQTAEDGKMATPPEVGVDGSPVFVLVGAVIPRYIYARRDAATGARQRR